MRGLDHEHRRRNCLVGSAIAGYFLELAAIAATSGLIAWICLLIQTRWPSTFPLLFDFVYVLTLGVIAMLIVHVSGLLQAHSRLLEGLGQLGAALASEVSARDALQAIVGQVRASINKEDSIAAITGTARRFTTSSAVLSACSRIESAYIILETPLLHRMLQASVYVLALALPFPLWYQFQWFTILVVPVAMTPILLLRQYGSKLRAASRSANRDCKEWAYLDLRLNMMLVTKSDN